LVGRGWLWLAPPADFVIDPGTYHAWVQHNRYAADNPHEFEVTVDD